MLQNPIKWFETAKLWISTQTYNSFKSDLALVRKIESCALSFICLPSIELSQGGCHRKVYQTKNSKMFKSLPCEPSLLMLKYL